MKILTGLLFLLCTIVATAYWGRWYPHSYNDGRYYVYQSIENNIILGTKINNENYYYEYTEGYLGHYWDKYWKLLQIPLTYQPYLKYYFKLSAPPVSNIKFYDRESQGELLDLEFVALLGEDVEMRIFKKAAEGMIFKGDGENKSNVVMVSSDLSRNFAFETPDEPFDLLECFFFTDKIILKTQSSGINYMFFDWDGKFLKQESEQELGIALYKVMPYSENYLIYNKKDDEYNVSEYNSELSEIKRIHTFEQSENVNRFVHHSGDYLFIMDINDRVFTQKILSKNVTFSFTFDFMNYRYPVNTITEDSTTYLMFMDQHYGPEYNPKNFNEKMTDMLIYNPEKPSTYKKINQGLTGYNMQEFLMTGFYNSGYYWGYANYAVIDKHSLIGLDYHEAIKIDSALIYHESEGTKNYTSAHKYTDYFEEGIFWISEGGKAGYFDLETNKSTKMQMEKLPVPEGTDDNAYWTLEKGNTDEIIIYDRKKIGILKPDIETHTVPDYEFTYVYDGDSPEGIRSVVFLDGNYYMVVEGQIKKSSDLKEWETVVDDVTVERILEADYKDLCYLDERQNIYVFNTETSKIDTIAEGLSSPPLYLDKVKDVMNVFGWRHIILQNNTDSSGDKVLTQTKDRDGWFEITENLPTGRYNKLIASNNYPIGGYLYIEGAGIYYLDIFTSVEDAETLPQPKIYPQPAKNIVNFDISMMNLENSDIEIFDLQGKKIDAFKIEPGSQNFGFSTADLNPGIYFIRLNTAEGNKLYKFNVE